MVAVEHGIWRTCTGPGGQYGRKTQEANDAKPATLAATMLAVQEASQPEALDDLVDRLDGSWTVVLPEHPDPRGG